MACNLGPDLSIRGGSTVVTDQIFSNDEAKPPNQTRNEVYIDCSSPRVDRRKLHQPRTPQTLICHPV